MCAGEGFVLTDGDGDLRRDFPDERSQLLCILKAVSVRNADRLFPGAHTLLFVFLYQRLDRLGPSAHLRAGDDMTRFISEEDRLDVEHGSDLGGHAADPAGVLQEVQVIDGKVLTGVRHFLVQDRGGFSRADALPAQFRCPHGQKPVAEAAAQRIHDMDESAAVKVHQFLGRDSRGVVGPADPGTHADIDDVDPLGQDRSETGQEQAGIQKRRTDDSPVSQTFIKRMRVEGIDISPIGKGFPVDGIVAGEEGDSFQHAFRQIRAAVGKHCKRHYGHLFDR